MVAIKGHFDGKVFVPEEPVDLPCGQKLILHIEQATPQSQDAAKPENGQKDFWGVLDELSGTIEMPADWSLEHDHYLYGTPKRYEKKGE